LQGLIGGIMIESIETNHLDEWLNSGVDKEIIFLNVLSLSGYNPHDYLLYGLEDTERRNDGRLKDKWLKFYRHVERGGWWCSGIDLLTDKDSLWGCFKPDFPRIPHQQHKPIKYEHPLQVPTEIFALKVPDCIWHQIADRFGIAITSKKNTTFWQWVIDNPRLPILITEGAKKAGALLSAGYCAIALPGIYNGYRDDDGKHQLIPQLAAVCATNREFVFAFDSDKKYKTKEAVTQAIANTGKLLQEKGRKVSVVEWNANLGKGIDDLLVSKGADYFDSLFEARLRLREYEESKKKKTQTLDSVKLLEFLVGEFDGRLSFDDLRCEILLDGKPIVIADELKSWFNETYSYNCNASDLLNHLTYLAKKNTFNPVEQYLAQCHKTAKRIPIDNLATRYFGTDSPFYNVLVKKWLIGSVARILQPGCKFDNALILQGKQNICKTTFFQILGGQWFDNSLGDIGNKDSYLVLHLSWIHELGEFDRITSKKAAGEIKDFLTRQNDVFRKPYGREALSHPRRSAICGSVNKNSFLLDETGNRRFWIIPIPETLKRIDIEMLAKERDGIWASAVDAFLNKEQWWLTDEQEDESSANNILFEIHDEWESDIGYHLDACTEVSVSEILSKVFGLEPAKHDRQTQMRVSAILIKLGWQKRGRVLHQGKRQAIWKRGDKFN